MRYVTEVVEMLRDRWSKRRYARGLTSSWTSDRNATSITLEGSVLDTSHIHIAHTVDECVEQLREHGSVLVPDRALTTEEITEVWRRVFDEPL